MPVGYLYPCLLLFCLTTFSCVSTKKAVYFSDQQDAALNTSIVVPEIVLQKNDLVGITVSSLNPQASSIFNASVVSNTGGNSVTTPSGGYLVNTEGTIQFPILGKVKAAGLTVEQLRASITGSLVEKKLLVDPIVNVRLLNFKVTILGEVGNPTVINVPNEKITLLEALGLAGDLTIFAKRDNIMVIREQQNAKVIKRINLNTSELFNSEYYYLNPNDIVYVEPNKARVASGRRSIQVLPLVLSGLSFTAIIVDRLTAR